MRILRKYHARLGLREIQEVDDTSRDGEGKNMMDIFDLNTCIPWIAELRVS